MPASYISHGFRVLSHGILEPNPSVIMFSFLIYASNKVMDAGATWSFLSL